MKGMGAREDDKKSVYVRHRYLRGSKFETGLYYL